MMKWIKNIAGWFIRPGSTKPTGKSKYMKFNCKLCGTKVEGVFGINKKYCSTKCQQKVAGEKYSKKLKAMKKKKVKPLKRAQAYKLYKQLDSATQLDILDLKRKEIMKDTEFDKVIHALERDNPKPKTHNMELTKVKKKKRFYPLENFK